ncbi:aldehyde dehydrogenase [Dyella jiangningensis]|nr:aldehyde dehydrogenase [Dyella jiangningensis]
MKAVVYRGPRDVRVVDVPDARIEKPTDVLVRVTTTNICGSDLHMYDGRTEVKPGQVLGHENMGEVIEVGNAVQRVKVGDLVCLPFNVSCGFCENCERGLTGFCLTVNPGKAGGAYGYSGMGPYSGGQAELLRVPFGDFNCLVLPDEAREQQNDYVMLSDIFPTGYHATELAGVLPGETVVIYGAGPVGLLATLSAFVRGASRVFVVDTHKDRLAIAEKLGAIPIDDTGNEGAKEVVERTGGGADRGCECVGYQCFHGEGHEVPNLTMNNLVQAVKATGSIGVVGVFMPKDPGGADDLAKKGQIAFDMGQFFTKGQRMGTGQCNVKAYNRRLCRLIEAGKAKPSIIVSHELPLEEAADGYRHFDAREDGWTKVVLKPGS